MISGGLIPLQTVRRWLGHSRAKPSDLGLPTGPYFFFRSDYKQSRVLVLFGMTMLKACSLLREGCAYPV